MNTDHVNFVVNVLCPDTTLRDRIIFFHAVFRYPVISTFCKALDNGLVLTGHLTSKQVRKHLKFSEYTVKGHLIQERQGIQSTNTPPPSKKKIEADFDQNKPELVLS